MGRRKIEIQPIANERNRSVTFLKRKNGLFKKAYELGVLCSVDVAVIVFETRPGHSPKLHQYSSSPDINRIVQKQMAHSGEVDTKYPRDFAGRDAADEEDDDDDMRGGLIGNRKTAQPQRAQKRPGEMDSAYMQSNRSGMYPNVPDPSDRYSHSALRDAMHAHAQAITGANKRPRLDDDPDPSRTHFPPPPPSTFYSVGGMPVNSPTGGTSPGGAPPYMGFAPGVNFNPTNAMYPGTAGGGRMESSYRLPEISHAPTGNGAGPPRSSSPMIWPTGGAGPSGVSHVTSSPHPSRPSSARLSPGPSANNVLPRTTAGGARLDNIVSSRNQPPSPLDGEGRNGSSALRDTGDKPTSSDRNEESALRDGGTKK